MSMNFRAIHSPMCALIQTGPSQADVTGWPGNFSEYSARRSGKRLSRWKNPAALFGITGVRRARPGSRRNDS